VRWRPGRARLVVAAAALLLAAAAVAAIAFGTSSTTVSPDARALAKIDLPLGGGKIKSVLVTTGRTRSLLPVELRGTRIWPRKRIPAGQRVTIEVVVKRPSAIAWLTGSTDRVRLTLTTPAAQLRDQYLTLAPEAPLRLRFSQPVERLAYGQPGALRRERLAQPQSTVELPRSSAAGSELVFAAARTWEDVPAATVSWFPAGTGRASAVATPAPGTRIGPSTALTLTFSVPVDAALGGHMPPVSPATSGTWQTVNSHTIVFRPQGFGYGLGATVNVPLPAGVQLAGANGSVATWTVPPGSTLRLQQVLARLGYLPVTFQAAKSVPLTPSAQEQAAVNPPAGNFTWRYPNTPSALRSVWQPGTSGTVTRGAVMAFENDQGMTADGVAGADVWKALLAAAIANKASTFGYTFVTVSTATPQSETTWHNGRVVASGAVNTGIPGAATALGLYPVFLHALSVTMSGTNPSGSHYSDPGVPYVSYFNGGDALHGFLRGSYGSAQSLGCVEMPYSEAAAVYPFTPIGTLVNVV
jgi:lipoprotein-anchoring transpeptidase ErfK/SrfK